MINILLTGAYGQVGTALRRIYTNKTNFNLILSSLTVPVGNPGISLDVRNKVSINEIFKSNVNERLPGSIASVLATYQKGAHIFRVHNAKETIQALNQKGFTVANQEIIHSGESMQVIRKSFKH